MAGPLCTPSCISPSCNDTARAPSTLSTPIWKCWRLWQSWSEIVRIRRGIFKELPTQRPSLNALISLPGGKLCWLSSVGDCSALNFPQTTLLGEVTNSCRVWWYVLATSDLMLKLCQSACFKGVTTKDFWVGFLCVGRSHFLWFVGGCCRWGLGKMCQFWVQWSHFLAVVGYYGFSLSIFNMKIYYLHNTHGCSERL